MTPAFSEMKLMAQAVHNLLWLSPLLGAEALPTQLQEARYRAMNQAREQYFNAAARLRECKKASHDH